MTDTQTAAAPIQARELLADFSLEMTGKDLEELEKARDAIPPGTRINVTYLAHEQFDLRVAAARGVSVGGFAAVPHISARRLASEVALRDYLHALREVDATQNVFVVGGDPAVPEGPYEDALAVIRSGLLEEFGAQRVSISGYPEGHPEITDRDLWSALASKASALEEQGLAGDIITQFGFDLNPVLEWVETVRSMDITMPIRVGVPGPAGVKRLLTYAKRFGVGIGAGIARKYGLSLTNLMSTAGPDRFLNDLADAYDPQRHGSIAVHFYTFGGLRATSEWASAFTGAR